MSSVTKQCQMESKMVQGRQLAVIDTPGWFDTSLSTEDVQDEVIKCLAMCDPGPHAFLLIIAITRFTDEQQKCIDLIKKVFQENFTDHTLIIFTHADLLNGEPIESFISRQDKKIQALVEQFGRRFLAFNNKDPEDNQSQVDQLLKKLDELLAKNNYCHFINKDMQAVHMAIGILEQNKKAVMDQEIKRVRQEVAKEAEHRREEINNTLMIEKQDIQRRSQHIQGKIKQINELIRKESERQRVNSQRLQHLQEFLDGESKKLTNLKEEQEMVVKEAEIQMEDLDAYIREEEEKREREVRENIQKEDGSKWYKNPFYFKMLKYLLVFLGGAGIGLGVAPLLGFLAPAAPAGLTAELTALLGPEVVAILTAAAAKVPPLVAVAVARASPLLAGQCSIQ